MMSHIPQRKELNNLGHDNTSKRYVAAIYSWTQLIRCLFCSGIERSSPERRFLRVKAQERLLRYRSIKRLCRGH